MIEATCSACGTVNRIAEADVPVGAKFVACSSCKSRVILPAQAAKPASPIAKPGPKPMAVPSIPKIPGPAKPPELADLPAPKRTGPLAGMEASKPAPKSGLDLADLPAPKSPSARAPLGAPLELDDLLPAPKSASPKGISDLPAPKSKSTAALPPRTQTKQADVGVTDLPTPKANVGITDLPAPKAARPATPAPINSPLELDIVDLPTPKEISDLPTPKHGGGIDLPAPKGFFDDLPQPARTQQGKGGGVDLPAPKGFFDDLPQPARSSTAQPVSDGLAPKGFFDDLPQPAKATTPSLPAPKGFFDDLPDPQELAPKGAAATVAPPLATGKSTNVFDDLPEPGMSSDLGELDLGPSSAPLELDTGPAGDLDLGLAAPTNPPAHRGDFADLDLSAPTALPPPQVKSGISIKATGKAAAFDKASQNPAAPKSTEMRLDLEDERTPVGGLLTPAKRDAQNKKQSDAQATAESKAKNAKRRKIALGALLGLALVGSGGGYFYKRYTDKKAREAEIQDHVTRARAQIHEANPNHWTTTASEAAKALELDSKNVEAIGLQAEAMLGGVLDTGLGGDVRVAAGRKKLADAMEAGLTGPQFDAAQALGMIASNQAERAVTKLQGMVQHEPKNGFWQLYLGWALAAKGNPADAVKAFDAALAADPRVKLPVLYARGKAKLQLVDLDGAKADFAAVLDLAKDHIGAQVGLAAAMPPQQSSQREADLLAILARKDIGLGDPRAVVMAWTLAADVARIGGRLDVARDRYHKALDLSKLDINALVGLARVEIQDGKLAVAQDLVQKALTQQPENVDAQLVAADLYVHQAKLNDAFAITQKLAAHQPPLPPAQQVQLMLTTGNVLEAQGQDDQAIDAWTAGAKVAGDSDLAPLMKAVTKLGDLAKKAADNKDTQKATDYRARADALLSALADRAQDDAALSKALGIAYLGAEDATKAEHFLRRSVDMKGDDVDTHLELAKALAKLQRTNDALDELKAAQKIDPTRADIALEIARTLEEAGRTEEALAAYQKLIAAKDPPVAARERAGRFLAKNGDIANAAAQADPILAAEPDSPTGHYLKGEGLIASKHLDDAIKELTLATEGDPDPQFLDAQGRAAEDSVTSGDTKYQETALRAYERAIAAAPQMFNPQAGTGRIYIQRKEFSKALPYLIAAANINKKSGEVFYNAGLAYKYIGQPATAAQWLTDAIANGKKDGETYWQLAQIYRDSNNPKQLETLRQATHLAQEQETKAGAHVDWLTDAYYLLGQVEYLAHDWPAAKQAYQSFLGRNPPPGPQKSEAQQELNGELK
jgi:tetratricopeptide (TPR) repeat protein